MRTSGTDSRTTILRTLRDEGPSSRARLGDLTGLSRPKVLADLDDLQRRELVHLPGEVRSRGGRPSSVVELSPRLRVVGVDVGATSVDVALTDGCLGVRERVAEVSDVRRGPEVVLGRVVELVQGLLEQDRDAVLTGIGVGVPGPVRSDVGVPMSPPIMPGWNMFPVQEWLSVRLGAPVVVDNDVNVMALGEMHSGVARGVDVMVFVKLGTGVGAGLVIDGEVFRGPLGSAGDIGHVCLDPSGPLCACGRRGCLETYAGGDAIAGLARAAVREGRSPALAAIARAGGVVDAEAVGVALAEGDAASAEIVLQAARRLGTVVASLVNILNPSLVVIGGGVVGVGHALLAEVRSVVYRSATAMATRNLPIVLSELADQAGVVGAAVLGSEHSFTQLERPR